MLKARRLQACKAAPPVCTAKRCTRHRDRGHAEPDTRLLPRPCGAQSTETVGTRRIVTTQAIVLSDFRFTSVRSWRVPVA